MGEKVVIFKYLGVGLTGRHEYIYGFQHEIESGEYCRVNAAQELTQDEKDKLAQIHITYSERND